VARAIQSPRRSALPRALARPRLSIALLGLLAALGLGACTDTLVVTPVVDLPVNDPSADAFPDLDQITLEAAYEGATTDLVSQTYADGAALSLPSVPLVDNLVIHMTGLVDGIDVAYGRTCEFSAGPGVEPHLFFSRSAKFASLGVAPTTRTGGFGVTYHDGSAILLGGVDGSGVPVVGIEQFQPADGTLATVAQVSPRLGAIPAAIGTAQGSFQIALLGGTDPTGSNAADFVEVVDIDAVPPTVQRMTDTIVGRVGLTASTLADGSVVAIGGNSPDMPPVGDVDAVAFDAGSLDIQQLHGMLAVARTGHTATALGDDDGANLLIVGGVDGSGAPVAVAELYQPLEETFAVFTPPALPPTLNVPRSQHQAVLLPDDTVLIVGGVDGSGAPVLTLERFHESTNTFTEEGELPSNAGVVGFTATTLPDGRILLAGGSTTPGGPPTSTAEIVTLDDLDGTVDVVATDNLAVARAGHQAALMCDGTVWLSGGAPDGTVGERYNPPATDRR
jgi:hypothetical protein